MAELPLVSFDSAPAWEAWLADHHTTSAGVWLRIAKKGAAQATPSYAEALEVALCYGWIDGQKGALDDVSWRQRFTPRRARSKWSKINCTKATELEASGRMRPAGRREVEAARADGRWDAAYDSHRTATVPPDLRAALDGNPAADAFFATISSTNRYAILYRLQDAKKPETRARRIATFVEMLAAGETIH